MSITKELAGDLKDNPEFLEHYIYLLRELGYFEEAKVNAQAYLKLVPDDVQMQELFERFVEYILKLYLIIFDRYSFLFQREFLQKFLVILFIYAIIGTIIFGRCSMSYLFEILPSLLSGASMTLQVLHWS